MENILMNKNHSDALRSVVVFIVCYFVLFLFLSNLVSYTPYFKGATVYCVSSLLKLLSFEPHILDDSIEVSYILIGIIPDCSCFYEWTLFLSLLTSLSFIQLKEKLWFAVVGLPILFLFSIIRVTSIIVVGVECGMYWFNVFHTYLWSFSSILFPALLLLIMIKVIDRRKIKKGDI